MAVNPIVDSRDVRFILFEMLEMDSLTKFPKYADFDRETFQSVIDLAETIAVEKVYPINSAADKKHAQYKPDTKEVIIPEEYFPGLNAYHEAGFLGIAAEQDLGGMGMPETIFAVATDYFSAASIAFTMYPMLSIGALNLVKNFYTGADKDLIIQKLITGEWGGTMCLTEPDAGSDVGALKTKAMPIKDNEYKISGQKIFISSGDNNYYKNNIHPVLARIEGDPAGTKGISIFVVPKTNYTPDGKLTGSNDVVCAGIEHKMGITASATCTLSFGDEGKCVGRLMGDQRKGMKIMFQMMNEARHFVGGQGMSVSSAAYMHAATYAKNRTQGVHVTQMLNPEAKGVTIINHPDVKRMLLSMKSKVECMRALHYYCALQTDLIHVSEGDAKREAQAVLDFLIPINKAGNTDTSWDVTATAIQVYGGYGFIEEYPVAQYARDSKILSLYEGTNGIQSMDLTMRKLLMDKEQYNYSIFKKKIKETIAAAKGVVDDKYLKVVDRALAEMDKVVDSLKQAMAGGKFLHIFANATPLQEALTMLTYAWMALWGLAKATPKMKELVGDKKGEEREALLKDNLEAAFYNGRVLSSQFYLGSEFPKYFGRIEALLNDEAAVAKANDTVFCNTPAE
ncbi:MAG: acyl-CoA dehydrogenase [Spirochaetes bacterium]|nr:acyl-CoA dehydrogenase [Spirochaetota bacterium]